MTDGKPEELTPEEQHQQDEARVQGQLGVIDVTQTVTSIMSSFFGSGGGPGPFARTSFEGHDLNDMIDLVKAANPADLEAAGQALWDARDALTAASKELEDYVGNVDWKGQAGDEFRSFGRDLAQHALGLGAFADVAATQITAAGTGLASVHNSMPPRDTRLRKQRVEDIETVKQVEGNAEYEAAKRVEKDRQEAINQMNRLASFYAVSEQTLAAQEPPRFERVLKANVPPPSKAGPSVRAKSVRDLGDGPSDESGVSTVSTRSDSLGNADRSQRELDTARPVVPVSERETSVEIDSVVAPPATPTLPETSTLPSSTGGPGTGGGTLPPPAGGPANLGSRVGSGAKGPQGYAKSVGQSAGSLGKGGTAQPVGPEGQVPVVRGRARPVARAEPVTLWVVAPPGPVPEERREAHEPVRPVATASWAETRSAPPDPPAPVCPGGTSSAAKGRPRAAPPAHGPAREPSGRTRRRPPGRVRGAPPVRTAWSVRLAAPPRVAAPVRASRRAARASSAVPAEGGRRTRSRTTPFRVPTTWSRTKRHGPPAGVPPRRR